MSALIEFGELERIIKFGSVGALMGGLYVLFIFILTSYLQVYYIFSAILSYSFLIALSYFLNDTWTFAAGNGKNKMRKSWHRLSLYYFISLTGMGLNIVLLFVLTEYAHVYYLISSIIATCSVFAWSYLLNKKITWRSHEP